MRATFRFVLVSAIVSIAALAQQASPAGGTGLDSARFDELWQKLEPDPDALWRSVPWRIDLLAAQQEAARAHKPLFVWAMDGHPLGCT